LILLHQGGKWRSSESEEELGRCYTLAARQRVFKLLAPLIELSLLRQPRLVAFEWRNLVNATSQRSTCISPLRTRFICCFTAARMIASPSSQNSSLHRNCVPISRGRNAVAHRGGDFGRAGLTRCVRPSQRGLARWAGQSKVSKRRGPSVAAAAVPTESHSRPQHPGTVSEDALARGGTGPCSGRRRPP
jgi:hypothetical protein